MHAGKWRGAGPICLATFLFPSYTLDAVHNWSTFPPGFALSMPSLFLPALLILSRMPSPFCLLCKFSLLRSNLKGIHYWNTFFCNAGRIITFSAHWCLFEYRYLLHWHYVHDFPRTWSPWGEILCLTISAFWLWHAVSDPQLTSVSVSSMPQTLINSEIPFFHTFILNCVEGEDELWYPILQNIQFCCRNACNSHSF